MAKPTNSDPILPGARYRATHQASVDAILNPLDVTRRVVSAGDAFLNVDNWFARMLVHEFCVWSKKNPDKVPTKADYEQMYSAANIVKVHDPFIQIAETPENLPSEVAVALIGSAYHEAWHTYYSQRSPVTPELAKHMFETRATALKWHSLESKLMFWSNLIEDIRIERAGCKEFPGSGGRMSVLQDFILDKESDVERTSEVVISCLFRDLGKGYKTERLSKALSDYQKADPVAFLLVTAGPLKKHLDKAISLGPKDNIDCFTLAMDILITLNDLAENSKSSEEAAEDMNTQQPQSSSGGGSDSDKEESKGNTSSGGGSDEKDQKGKDKITANAVSKVAKDALSSDAGAMDASDALRRAIQQIMGNCENKLTRNGAKIYRPFSTSFDRVIDISSDNAPSVASALKQVRSETSYLRTRLRQLFRATELVDIEHGMKTGRNISERMLTESVCLVRNGHTPDRPFFDTTEAPDMSMSAVIVLDESASMHSKLERSTKILLALTEALDSIGCKTSVVGFMRAYDSTINDVCGFNDIEDGSKYHRYFPMKYHIFKRFEEKFHYTKNRLGALNANGDTPMGDGINFAINQLSNRKEGHRFIFVVTDGQPDDYGPVHNRIDAASTIGIKTVGVGLGKEASYVKECFPDHVWANEMSEMPALLVRKLTGIVERNEMRRGRRLSKHLEVR